jgi:predicted Abi (CAAX) family protease
MKSEHSLSTDRAKIVRGRLRDVWTSVVTLPGWNECGQCLRVYGLFLACVIPLGVLSGFFEPGFANLSRRTLILLPLYLALRPALVEELVFRTLLLPRNIEGASKSRLAFIGLPSLALFVASHPLHGWLTRPAAMALFTDPIFLLCAALLGVTCTLAYWITRSIWPPVVLHWISVLVWILFLGGQGLVGTAMQQ